MSDPRLTPFNGRVAHVSLEGQVDAERFSAGEQMQIALTKAPLLRMPDGPMDRELLFGRKFLALDAESADPWVYGIADRDGYCGWVHGKMLSNVQPATHTVAVRESYFKPTPDLKTTEWTFPAFLGSEVSVSGTVGDWSRVGNGHASTNDQQTFYLPSCHLRPVSEHAHDPVDVARLFLGTPYLWGGNSGRGIDCSGLVQAAFHTCGFSCPGDSDQQESMSGEPLGNDAELISGDLIFWHGHVALVASPTMMIHSNAYHMNTVEESISEAIARIAKSETGPVTSRLRPSRIELLQN
ncbi:MAG: NlpC/P60 family protein [Boseongicola sp.]